MLQLSKQYQKIILPVLAIAIFGIGCGSGGSSSGPAADGEKGMNNLPASLSISIPKSLGIEAGGASGSVINKSISKASVGVPPTSFSYYNVNSSIIMMKSQLSSMATNMVIVDRIIDGLIPSDTAVTGKTITITQGMQDTMIELLPENERAAMTERFKHESLVGRAMPVGSFVYKTISDANYKYSYIETNETGTFAVMWSGDKTLLKVVSVSPGYTYGIVRDITDKTSKMYIICNMTASQSPSGEAINSTSIISMKQASGSQKNAVALSDTYINRTATDVSSYTFEGVADDDGGYIVNSVLQLYSAGVIPQKSDYIEGFDSTGTLTYQKNGAFVVYGAEPAVYKTAYDDADVISVIQSMQGTCNNDAAITGKSADTLFKDASGAVKGDVYVIFNSTASAVTSAISGYNTDQSNSGTYLSTLSSYIVGVAMCDKNGSISLYITDKTRFAAASTLYLSKVDYTNTLLGTIQSIAK